jgi:hypothetical protein
MRLTLSLLVSAMFVLPLGGCLVTSRGHSHGHVRSGGGGGGCHPSQYWDGRQCRHKGRGHGARKHDGR